MNTTNDPIADLLTRVRNAQLARHARVEIPGSKIKLAIARILQTRGYVGEVTWSDEGPQGRLAIELRYDRGDEPIITCVKRESRPARRVYVGVDEIPKVLNGLGVAILSTSKGVLSDDEARAAKVGGELLCTVY